MNTRYLTGLFAAALFAALAPALAVAALSQSVRVAPLALWVTLGHVLLLGLPLFFFLQSKGWVNGISSMASGFAIGSMPMGFLLLISQWSMQSASIGGTPTVINHVMTLRGWLYYFEFLVYLGALGAFAGYAFWLILSLSDALANSEQPSNSGPGQRSNPGQGLFPAALLAVTAMSLAAAVFAVPALTKDRTCHNMFRDGHTSISPQVRISLGIDPAEWPALTEEFDNFGKARALSFRKSRKQKPGEFDILFLSLCNEQGLNIEAHDQRWASKNFKPLNGRGIAIPVYEVRQGSGWQEATRELVANLEMKWPGRVQFLDGGGRITAPPNELQTAD
jgi:hypothetical protein